MPLTISDADAAAYASAIAGENTDAEAAYQAIRGKIASLSPLVSSAAAERAAHTALTVRAEAAAAAAALANQGGGGTTTPTTSTIALLHLTEASLSTRPAVWVNSVPGGVTFNNWGDGRVTGAESRDSVANVPFGLGALAQSSIGGTCAITSNTPITFDGNFTVEGFFNIMDDSRDLMQFSTNGNASGTMRIRLIAVSNGAGGYFLRCRAQNGGAEFIAFDTDTLTPATVAGATNSFHYALQRRSGILELYCNGNRAGLATTAVNGGLSGYLDIFGSYDRVNDNANGMFTSRISELRASNVAIYSGTTYTVPTARFANPA